MAACFATMTLACSEQGSPPASHAKENDMFLERTPVEEACENVIDGRTRKDIGREEVYTRNQIALFSHVPDRLRRENLAAPMTVCSFSLDSAEEEKIDISFSWSSGGSPFDLGFEDRSSVHQLNPDVAISREGTPHETKLWTRCRLRQAPRGQKGEPFSSVLEGSLTDKVGISSLSRTRLLVESMRRVADQVDCTNSPNLPSASEIESTFQSEPARKE